MGSIKQRDGHIQVKSLKLDQKRYVEDTYQYVLPSTTILFASADIHSATTDQQLGTTLDCPRAIKVINNMQAAAERKAKLIIKGYTGQGEYAEETLTLSSNATGRTAGSMAFAYISAIKPAAATLGYGTYSTVTIYPINKFGLREYCDDEDDIFEVDIYRPTVGTRSVSTSVISTTTFSKTYQTLNLNSLNTAGSTLVIKYRSRFQRPDSY